MKNKLTTIEKCFQIHKELYEGDIKFTFEEYKDFWEQHSPNKEYRMVNRDKSEVACRVVYYPLPAYKDLRALIQLSGTTDFREVPVRFLLS